MRNVIYLIFRLFSINFQIHQTSHLNWAILSTVVIFIRGGAELLSRGDYPQSSNRGCRERLSRPPIKQFPASRSPISCYLYLLNWQKFAFDHRENLVSFSRRINALVSSLRPFFFRVLARIIFTTDHTFTRQHRRGLLLCYGIACLLSHLASIPTYFSLQLCTCIRKWPFDSHFVPLITFAEAFRIGNLCFEMCWLFIVDHVSRHNLIERNKFGGAFESNGINTNSNSFEDP